MSGFCKYYKQKKQVSYDNGITWQDVKPYEYQRGELYQGDSSDCGYQYLERWINSGTTCSGTSGYDKYYLQIKQISNDGGQSWITTSDSRLGSLIEINSSDCGYVPPTNIKFSATYSDGRTYSAECDSSRALAAETTKPSGYEYTAMTRAEIGDCITYIISYAFYDCSSLTGITIPNGVTSIGNWAFAQCKSLPNITIPDSVTSIGNTAFYQCSSLTSVTIPNGVTSIGKSAFQNCSGLTSCTIGSGVTSISEQAFYYCFSLTSVTIPNSVTSIGNYAFDECSSLPSITIPDSVTTLGNGVFVNCFSLTSVTIPNGVTSIGKMAFNSCSGLTSVTVNATTPPTLGSGAFDYTNNCPIYVPSGSVNAYKSASGWSTYSSRIQAIPT